MEVLFENHYTMTKERFKEWAKHPIRKNHFNLLWIALIILSFIMMIISFLWEDTSFLLLYLCFIIFCFYKGFFHPKILISKYFKILETNQGADHWERVIQFTDCIHVTDGNSSSQYQWDQVIALYDRSEYLVLVFRNNIGIRLIKNGFVNNTCDAFLQYMKAEHPNIQIVEK